MCFGEKNPFCKGNGVCREAAPKHAALGLRESGILEEQAQRPVLPTWNDWAAK